MVLIKGRFFGEIMSSREIMTSGEGRNSVKVFDEKKEQNCENILPQAQGQQLVIMMNKS